MCVCVCVCVCSQLKQCESDHLGFIHKGHTLHRHAHKYCCITHM